jgi:hypothetical protein
VSKEDRGAAAEHVLRLGEALHARAGAGNAGGSGGSGASWRGREGPTRGLEGGGQGVGGHVAWLRAVRGRPVRGTWPARAAGSRAEKTESRGLEVHERGSVCNFSKV